MCVAPINIKNPRLDAPSHLIMRDGQYGENSHIVKYGTDGYAYAFRQSSQINVKCGHCAECISEKANDLAFRTAYEVHHSQHQYFITLTYAEGTKYNSKYGNLYFSKHMSTINYKGQVLGVVNKKHAQQFIKALYDRFKKDIFLGKVYEVGKFRYLLVSEYGKKSHRPHYHAYLYNCPVPIGHEPYDNESKNYIFKCVQHAWSHFNPNTQRHTRYGIIDVERPRNVMACAKYVTNYMTKTLLESYTYYLDANGTRKCKPSVHPQNNIINTQKQKSGREVNTRPYQTFVLKSLNYGIAFLDDSFSFDTRSFDIQSAINQPNYRYITHNKQSVILVPKWFSNKEQYVTKIPRYYLDKIYPTGESKLEFNLENLLRASERLIHNPITALTTREVVRKLCYEGVDAYYLDGEETTFIASYGIRNAELVVRTGQVVGYFNDATNRKLQKLYSNKLPKSIVEEFIDS